MLRAAYNSGRVEGLYSGPSVLLLNILIFSPLTKFSDLGDDNAMKITFTCLFDRSALTDGRRAVVLKADWHKVLVSDSQTVAAAVFFFFFRLNFPEYRN